LERITIINDVNGGGVNLAVTPQIREVGKAPFWGAITLTLYTPGV